MTEQRLLILGSLGEFVKLVKEARSRGIYTVVCDGYADGPAKQYADKAYNIDVRRVDDIVAMCKEEKINGIMGTFSDLLFEQICKIADKANLKWYVAPEMIPYYRDKSKAKELLASLGVHVPKNKELSREFRDSELDGFTFPLVAKPVNGYGSKGIFVIHSIDELRRHFDDIVMRGTDENVQVEEYTLGREYNLMCWVVDGKVYPLSIADRQKNPQKGENIPLLNRVAYPSRDIAAVLQPAVDVLQKFVGFTKQKSGPVSMQFFYNDNGVEVCEIAGRMFGYEHELVTYCSGLDVEKMLIDYVYDEASLKNTVLHHSPYFTRHYAGLYFVAENGKKLADQSGAEQYCRMPYVAESILFYKPGEIIDNYGPKPYFARYYITAGTRGELDAITDDMYKNIHAVDSDGKEIILRHTLEK